MRIYIFTDGFEDAGGGQDSKQASYASIFQRSRSYYGISPRIEL
jgi:hypothetical protein